MAVRRHCTDYIDGVRACESNAGQTWVIVVGNEDMYGSFANFQTTVSQSQFTENWSVNSNGDSVYYASIEMDSILIEHYWQPLVNTSVQESASEEMSFSIWPNPATETVNLDLSEFEKSAGILVVNSLGQLVCSSSISSQDRFSLPVSNWSNGIYSITVRGENKTTTLRFVKQ